MALTAKQAAFVAEYLIDLNATQAAIRAGYSEKTAEQQGSRLLSNAKVSKAVAAGKAKRAKRTEVTQDRVIAELAKLGFYDIRKAVTWGDKPTTDDNGGLVYPVEMVNSSEIDDDTAAAISEVSLTAQGIRIKMADKRAALESLLRHTTGDTDPDDAPSVIINITTQPAVGEIRVTRAKA